MSKRAITIELTAAERSALEDLAKRRRTAQGLARRARIVLAAAEGTDNKAIAQEIGADEKTVGKWRRRFAVHRIEGLRDEPRSGARRRIADAEIAETVRLTLKTTPPGATHWSLRAMGVVTVTCEGERIGTVEHCFHSAATAACQWAVASALKIRSVDRETRCR